MCSLKLSLIIEIRVACYFPYRVTPTKILRVHNENNLWYADEASGGLCGTCTEIHVDYSALNGQREHTCARCMVNQPNTRVVEIWNCVSITHRATTGPDGKTVYEELPTMSIDTGLGLERLASVMQVPHNFIIFMDCYLFNLSNH